MLLALLYTDDGFLAAAALACDQQPYGNDYWGQIHPHVVRPAPGGETAYVNIQDEALVERLLRMEFSDGYAAAEAVDEQLSRQARLLPCRAPFRHQKVA
jgi:hypothetical protein